MKKASFRSSEVTGYFASFNATLQIATFAAQLAEQAGEEVTWPLTKDQMNRAFQILRVERSHLFDLLQEAGMLAPADDSDFQTFEASVSGNSKDD